MTKKCEDRPYFLNVNPGESYFICTCGQSETFPLCDGAHKGSEFKPVKQEFFEQKNIAVCGCLKSGNSPLCDGSHSKK